MVWKRKTILLKKHTLKLFLLLALRLDNVLYKIISRLSVHYNGHHPKHHIIQYEKWFLGHVTDNDVIVDIGSNTGWLSSQLADKARLVYGIEIEQPLYEIANKNNMKSNLKYFCADATSFDYKKVDSVSVVTLSNVLEHIDKRVDFLTSIVQAINWDKEVQPKFLIRVPMINRDWVAVYKKELGVDWRLDPTHFIEYTFNTLSQEISEAGLKIELSHVEFGECYVVCSILGN